MMSLNSTIPDMVSDDYQRRFIAEYNQLKIRHDKLSWLIEQMATGRHLEFKPACDIAMLSNQLCIMKSYMAILETRAKIEGIDLTWQG